MTTGRDLTGDGGLRKVEHDGSLTGEGTLASPLVAAGAVVFDDATPADKVNIRSDRASDQSPIDNTKAGITNLGSQTLTNDPAATGATGAYSTIVGGDDATASGDYSAVVGGRGCRATGEGACAEGDVCAATGGWSRAAGSKSVASRETQYAHSGGDVGGFGTNPGSAMWSYLDLRGTNTGSPASPVTLIYGPSNNAVISLEDLRSYDFKVWCVVNGKIAGPTYYTRTFEQRFNIRRVGGTATIIATGASEDYGDSPAGWTMVASIASNDLQIVVTGNGTEELFCHGHVEFAEVRFLA